MQQPAWSRRLYDRQHEIWPRWSESLNESRATAEFLESWTALRPGSQVCDLGCGSGREAVAMALRGHRVTAVDLSPGLVERVRERCSSTRVHVDARVGDFLSLDLPHAFDLIYFWDSTLNIFDLPTAAKAVQRIAAYLNPRGWLLVQQLNAPFWSSRQEPFSICDPAIGPGRTERRYRLESGVLHDEVRYVPEGGGAPEPLPTQRLHLYSEEDFLATLRAIPLVDVRCVGSSGFSWSDPGPVSEASAMVTFAGRADPRKLRRQADPDRSAATPE